MSAPSSSATPSDAAPAVAPLTLLPVTDTDEAQSSCCGGTSCGLS